MKSEEKKKFDCIKMKRKGSQLIYETIKNMTKEEEVKYWRAKALKLKSSQAKIIKKSKKSA